MNINFIILGFLILAGVLLLPGAGISIPWLAVTVLTGVIILSLLSFAKTRRLKGVWIVTALWNGIAFPLIALEILGSLGPPGPRAVASVFCTWMFLNIIQLRVLNSLFKNQSGKKLYIAWPSRLFLMLAMFSFMLLVLESTLRPLIPELTYDLQAAPGSPPDYLTKDPVLVHTLTPFFKGRMSHWDFAGIEVRINEQGFRDRPWNETPSNRLRMLGIGDSFTFGMGVREEETFLRRLESMAPEASRLWTFNAGVPGYGLDREYRILQNLIPSLKPDIVVMALYTGNDLEDTYLFQLRSSPDRKKAEPPASKTEKHRYHLKYTLSDLATYIYWTNSSKICAISFHHILRILVRAGWADPRSVYNLFLIRSLALDPDPEVITAQETVISIVNEARNTCRDHGAHFMILLIPPLILVNESLFEKTYADLSKYDREDYSRTELHKRLRTACKAHDIPIIDLLPDFFEKHRNGRMLYHNEGHWNAGGHEAAASLLLTFLQEQKWL